MSFLNIQKFQMIFQKHLPHVQIESAFKSFEKKYKKSFNFDSYTKLIERINKTNKREAQKNQFQLTEKQEDKAESFVFGEFKIFTWVLVVYCRNLGISLEELNHQNYSEIQYIFQSKSLIFIKYEILCLIHQKRKYEKEWDQQEIELLMNIIMMKNSPNEWRIISFELFKKSEGGFYRPFQQCRQKWFNHLDPKVNRGEWTQAEDIALLTAAEFLGCKWAMISRQMDGVRTQHMVKNRYKSLISKWKRKKFRKKNPQQILSYILKQLKKKNEKIQQNFHQIEQPEVLQSENKGQSLIIQQYDAIIKEEIQGLQPFYIGSRQKPKQLQIQMEEQEDFDLGLDNIEEKREWKIQDQQAQDKLLMNYMRFRSNNFDWQPEDRERRKTSDNDEVENIVRLKKITQYDERLCQSQRCSLFDFSAENYFQPNGQQSPFNFQAIQNGVQSEWLRNLEQRNNIQWIDDSS